MNTHTPEDVKQYPDEVTLRGLSIDFITDVSVRSLDRNLDAVRWLAIHRQHYINFAASGQRAR